MNYLLKRLFLDSKSCRLLTYGRNLIFVPLILFLAGTVLISCKRNLYPIPDTGSKTITVVMDNNYPPFAFLDSDGNMQGILIDRWKLWEEKTGIKVEITGMDWSDALKHMEAGEFDVIDTIFFNESRAQIYDFSAPYQTIDVPIYFNNSISGITDAKSLEGFPVAVKKGDAVIDFLKSQGVDNLLEYDSYESIIKAAVNHEVIVFAMDKPPADYYLNRYNLQNNFNSTKPLYSGQFHRAVLKGNTALLAMIESGFGQIPKSEYLAIDRKWYGSPAINDNYVTYAGLLIAAGLLVFLFMIIWNQTLQANVRKKTKSLKESEQKFRGIFETSGIGISVANQKGQFVSGNPAILRILGYSAEEYSQLSINSISHPEDLDKNVELNRQMWAGVHDSFTLEKRNLHKNGRYIWGRVTSSIVRDDKGQPLFSFGLFEDISERKESEKVHNSIYKISQASNSSITLDELYLFIHNLLRELMPVDNFYIALYDPKDELLHFPFFIDQYEKSADPIAPGHGLTDFVLRGGKPLWATQQVFEQLLRSGEVELIGEKPVDWLGVPLIANDKVIGVMATQSYSSEIHFTQKDVELLAFVSTQVAQAIERKRAEIALVKSDSDLRALFSAMTDVILVLDNHGRYLKIMDTNTNLLYKPPVELIGKSLYDVFEKEKADFFLHHITSVLSSHNKVTFEYSLLIEEELLWFSAALTPVTEDSIIWVAHNITNRKQLEEARYASEKRYRNLFEDSPASLWEEDFSEVKNFLDDLKQKGERDIKSYFLNQPDQIAECISRIKVIDVNKATLKLMHAQTKNELIGNINTLVNREAQYGFIEEFVIIAEGKYDFDWEGVNNTLDGETINVSMRWSVADEFKESLARVLVSVIDITRQKQSEESLEYRLRFENLLSQISSRFINLSSQEIDDEINLALKLVGQFEKVDRSYVFRIDLPNQTMSNTHEWCENGILPQIDSIQKMPVSATPWLFGNIEDQPLIVNRVSGLPAEAVLEKKIFESQEIKSLSIFPMRVNQKLVGFVGFDIVSAERGWKQDDIIMLQQFANILSNAFERARLQIELEERAIRDELTNALNRRGFTAFATIEYNRSLRFNRPVGLILFDMDHLKRVNDTFGHTAGDAIIQEIVKCSLKNIREIDLLGRWGGDEFVVLLPESDLELTALVAERLRKSIEEHAFSIEGNPIRITISVGVAMVSNYELTLDQLFDQADSALYNAKQSGRNCVSCFK